MPTTLERMRLERGLSARRVSLAVPIHRKTLKLVEQGLSQPQPATVWRLAAFYHVNVEWLAREIQRDRVRNGMSMSGLGELMVTVSIAGTDTDALADEHRLIHDEFTRTRDAEHSYLRMGFLAAKAIGWCRQLEGSDGGHSRGHRDRDPVVGDEAQARDRAPESPRAA